MFKGISVVLMALSLSGFTAQAADEGDSVQIIENVTAGSGFWSGDGSTGGYKSDFYQQNDPAIFDPTSKGGQTYGWYEMNVDFRYEDEFLTYTYWRDNLGNNPMETDDLSCNSGRSLDRRVVFNEADDIERMEKSDVFTATQVAKVKAILGQTFPNGGKMFKGAIVGKKCLPGDSSEIVIPLMFVTVLPNGQLAMQAFLGPHPSYPLYPGRSSYLMDLQ